MRNFRSTPNVRAARTLALGMLVAIGSAAANQPLASAASQRITDKANLHLVKSDGNTIMEAGKATGTLPGAVRITVTLRGSTATSAFQLTASGGTLFGTGSGKVKAGKNGYESFGGSLHLVHGTGRFKGASGRGGLYGTIYRVAQDEPMSVQVTGTLRT